MSIEVINPPPSFLVNLPPLQEIATYNSRTYKVYKTVHLFKLAKKIHFVVQAIWIAFIKFISHTFQTYELALRYGGDNLRKDRAFALKAIKQNAHALKFMHEELKQEKEFILEAIEQNKYVLRFVSEDLQKNNELFLEVIKKDGTLMHYLPEDLKKDKAFILEVIKEDGSTFQYAHEELKRDKEFVLEAIKENCYAFQYTHEDLRQNREFVLKVAKENGTTFQYAHPDLRKDKQLVLEAAKENGLIFQYADEDLRKNKTFILEIIKQNGYSFEYIHEDLKQDKELVLEAIKQNGLVLLSIDSKDPKIIELAHQSLSNRLQILLEDTHQAKALFKYASCIIGDSEALCLHDEHPLLQSAIEAYCISSACDDPNSPYHMHANLQNLISKEALLSEFEGFRKRASKKGFTCADIPAGIIPLQVLFETIEQRRANEKEIQELCCGDSLQVIKENVLGDGKVIPLLLAQKGSAEESLPITTMYLYSILKRIADADDIRIANALSPREKQLLKFASMVKECATGQADAIEQYYINTICLKAASTSQSKIEDVIDHAMQMALKKALASESLLQQITGKDLVQQSHQILYLQNRYHRQIGLFHTLRFDRHAGLVDHALIEKDPKEVLLIIKQHVHALEAAKQALDQALKGNSGVKIEYMEFISYFEKNFGLITDQYEQYIEFDEELTPLGITPLAVGQILKKLEYIK